MKKFFTTFLVISVVASTLLSVMSCGGEHTEKPGLITGVAYWRDPTGGSLHLTGVVVDIWDGNNNRVGSGVTGDDGKFTIKNIPVGIYTVTAYAPASADGTQDDEKTWLRSSVKVESDRETALKFYYQDAYGKRLPEQYIK